MNKTVDVRHVLQESGFFGGLGYTTLDQLARVVNPVFLAQGKILFKHGDTSNGCYAILSGILKVVLFDDEGHETFLAVLGSGDVVGEMGLLDSLPRSATVVALKDCELGYLSIKNFEQLADKNTEIYRYLLRVISGRLRSTNQIFFESQHLDLSERLAWTLQRLSEAYGETLPDGRILIRQKITQVQLANMTNSTRENINRQLNKWKKDKCLSRIGGYYCLNDVPMFKHTEN